MGRFNPAKFLDAFLSRLFSSRRDRLVLLAVASAAIVVASTWRIESSHAQTFTTFLLVNRVRLALVAAGLLLFGASLLPRAWSGVEPVPRTPNHDEHPSLPTRHPTRPRSWWLRLIGLAALSLGVVLFALMVRHVMTHPTGFKGPALFFSALIMIGVGMALLEAKRTRSWWRDLGFRPPGGPAPWWQRDAPWLVLLLVVWTAGMAWKLDTRPGFFHGDEATAIEYGHLTYRNPDPTRRSSPWTTQYQNYLSGVPRALLSDYGPHDRPYLGPRLYSVFLGVLSLAALFLLVRRALGRLPAWLALILTATNHVYIAFARSAILNIDGALMLAIWALAWIGAWRSRRPSLGFLSGVASALGYYTYHGALLGLVVSAALVPIEFIRNSRSVLARWMMILAFALGGLAGITPIHLFYRHNPQGMSFRTNFVSLLSGVNLDRCMKQNGATTVPELLLRHSWPGVGGYLLWHDQSSNYGYRGLPAITRPALALFLLALVAAVLLIRRRAFLALFLLWWGIGLLLSSVLTTSPEPPYLARSMMTLPALFTLAAWCLALLVRRVHRRFGRWGTAIVGIAAFLLVAQIAATNVYHYFWKYAPDRTLWGYRASPMGLMKFMHDFPPNGHLILYSDHSTQMYTACLSMYDTGFTRDLYIRPDEKSNTDWPRRADFKGPLPPPTRTGVPTAYVLKMPMFQQIDAKVAKTYPHVKPIIIKNPYVPDDPVYFKVYWIRREKEKNAQTRKTKTTQKIAAHPPH